MKSRYYEASIVRVSIRQKVEVPTPCPHQCNVLVPATADRCRQPAVARFGEGTHEIRLCEKHERRRQREDCSWYAMPINWRDDWECWWWTAKKLRPADYDLRTLGAPTWCKAEEVIAS